MRTGRRTVLEGSDALVGDLELEGSEEGGGVVQHRDVRDVHGAHRSSNPWRARPPSLRARNGGSRIGAKTLNYQKHNLHWSSKQRAPIHRGRRERKRCGRRNGDFARNNSERGILKFLLIFVLLIFRRRWFWVNMVDDREAGLEGAGGVTGDSRLERFGGRLVEGFLGKEAQ